MQLPFVAHLLPGVPIVPLVMGYQTTRDRVRAWRCPGARGRPGAGTRRVCWWRAATSRTITMRATAAAHGCVVLDHVERLDADGLMQALEQEPHHACGGGPMVPCCTPRSQLGATARGC